MKLSIIIPVYRTQDTLDRCLQSILQQSFTDYEIILVDDGSTDECPTLCDNYAQKYENIKVIHKINGGLSDARNAGIKKAQGEYITFVDSDDAIQEETLLPLMNELYQHPNVDILEYPVLERYGHPYKQHLLSFNPHDYNTGTEYWFKERAYQHTYAWNKIYKHKLFEHIRFPKGKNFEDALTIPKLLGLNTSCHIHPAIRVTNVGCYYYYWNTKGITANAKYEDLHNLYNAHSQTLEYIFKDIEGCQDPLTKYGNSLQDFMLRILNVLLDLYELSGKYEDHPPLTHYVEKLSKMVEIRFLKLKLFNLLGYHILCRLNKLLHRPYKKYVLFKKDISNHIGRLRLLFFIKK